MLFSPNKSVFDFSLIMQVNVVCDVFTTPVPAVSFNMLCDVISQTITFVLFPGGGVPSVMPSNKSFNNTYQRRFLHTGYFTVDSPSRATFRSWCRIFMPKAYKLR